MKIAASILFAITVYAAALMLIAGCGGNHPDAMGGGIGSAGNDNSGTLGDINAIQRNIPAIKLHADVTGNALLDQLTATANHAAAMATATAADLKKASADLASANTATAKAIADAKAAQAEADGHAFATHSLYILAIAGVPIFALAVGFYLYSKIAWSAAIAAAAAILSLASIAMALTINVLARVTPVAAWCVGGLLVVVCVGLSVVAVIEIWIRSKTIIEQSKDSAGSKQPTIAYPPAVAKVITALVGPAAAEPVTAMAPVTVAGTATAGGSSLFLDAAASANSISGGIK